jgi:hypothetical protein
VTDGYATPCSAIRVFCGFHQPQLTEAKFLIELGRTFMPGTVYMLRPLGLCAYLPGVLVNPPAGLPNEFALICYPSREVWDHAMNGALRGRVYNQTHGSVYDLAISGAQFAEFVETLPAAAADPYYLFQVSLDWQAGFTHVLVGRKKLRNQSAADFRTSLRTATTGARTRLAALGIDQVIVAPRDNFAVLWLHGSAAELGTGFDFITNTLDAPTVLRNDRIVCRDKPPQVTLAGHSAFNWIFLRETKYFLR